jgi:glycosyltransferase involved in cell wall biosynthesis
VSGFDLSVCVACFDEEEALPRLFDELGRLRDLAGARGLALETVFVDDGSSDGTAALLRDHCAGREDRRFLSHVRTRGFGAAMRTAFEDARGRVLVCYDADATYPVEDALALFDALLETGADVAGATPFGAGGSARVGPLRLALSRGVAALYRFALRTRGRPPTVLTCAFRAYRREALRGVRWRADGFLAAAELLVRLLVTRARYIEMPSALSERVHGVSKMKVGRTAVAHLRFLAAVAVRAGDLRPPARAPAPVRRFAKRGPDDLAAWNAALNEKHPMRRIEEHGNPAVRFVEARRRGQVLKLVAARRGRLVLDVGSEEGAYAARLTDRGARPVAVDIDPAALSRGRRRHGAPCVGADAQALPFRDRSVSRVVLAEVLEHCPDPERALAEALRVVAASGRVAVSVPDDRPILLAKAWIRRLGLGFLIRGLPPGLAPGHLHVFDRAGLLGLLGGAGRVVRFTRDLPALAFFAVVAPRGEVA